ncbi:MAG: Crp/Fnr family transcriptional regulator [Terricaulis sp.]
MLGTESGTAEKASGHSSLRALRRCHLLAPVDAERLAFVHKGGEVRSFAAGEVMAADDTSERSVFFVLSGRFRVSMMTPSARYVAIRNAGPGDHFGEIALYTGQGEREFYVQCDQQGACFLMPERAFRELVRECPEIVDGVLQAISADATMRAERIYEFATLNLRFRLLAELVRLGRHGRHDGVCAIVEPAPTHEALAAQVGSSREAVTRLMQAFVKQNLLRVPRRGVIEIVDLDRMIATVARKTGIGRSHGARLDL